LRPRNTSTKRSTSSLNASLDLMFSLFLSSSLS
jgi:hypothetical protein